MRQMFEHVSHVLLDVSDEAVSFVRHRYVSHVLLDVSDEAVSYVRHRYASHMSYLMRHMSQMGVVYKPSSSLQVLPNDHGPMTIGLRAAEI